MTRAQNIDTKRWSLDELNVPFYPERRLFRRLYKGFSRLTIPDDSIVFWFLKGW